jgi:hypothetical protein
LSAPVGQFAPDVFNDTQTGVRQTPKLPSTIVRGPMARYEAANSQTFDQRADVSGRNVQRPGKLILTDTRRPRIATLPEEKVLRFIDLPGGGPTRHFLAQRSAEDGGPSGKINPGVAQAERTRVGLFVHWWNRHRSNSIDGGPKRNAFM